MAKRAVSRASLQAEKRAASLTFQALLMVFVTRTPSAAGKVLRTDADSWSRLLVLGGSGGGAGCSVAPLRVVNLQEEGVDEAEGSVGLAALQFRGGPGAQ